MSEKEIKCLTQFVAAVLLAYQIGINHEENENDKGVALGKEFWKQLIETWMMPNE